jgi:adenosylcobinamide-GDP ribazoletransferase
MVVMAYLSPYARAEGGLGQAMSLGVTRGRGLAAGITAGLGGGLLLGAAGLVMMAAAGLTAWGASRYFCRRLGGVTGDVYGAVNELQEVLALLVATLVIL